MTDRHEGTGFEGCRGVKFWVLVLLGLLAGLPLSRLRAAESSAPAGSVLSPQEISQLVERGRNALTSGDHLAAYESFSKAYSADRANTAALHGKGLAAFKLSRLGEAIECLEEVYRRSRDGENHRIAAYNLAAVHLQTNPMRAARVIQQYLQAHPAPPDEDMANALGAALNRAGRDARRGSFFTELRQFYMNCDERLASARKDGNHRWGTMWISAAQADAKWRRYIEACAVVEDLEGDEARAGEATDRAWKEWRFIQRDLRLYTQREKASIWNTYLAESRNLVEVRKQLDAARKKLGAVEVPPLLDSLDVSLTF